MITRAALLILALLVFGCATDRFAPPPISPTLVERAQADHATRQELLTGRKLFATRCLECHTMPPVTKYRRDEWPHLVSRMSSRADLTAAEEQSVVAYLRAASHP